MRIAVLYSSLAPYFVACLTHALKELNGSALVYCDPVVGDAPFAAFDFEGMPVQIKGQVSAISESTAAIREFDPDIVLVSGWGNPKYLEISKSLRQKGYKVVGASDTQWRGSFRQIAARVIAPWHVKAAFDLMWVSGGRQARLARWLGFRPDQILTGFYSCDTATFSAGDASQSFKKQFLYVGRLVSSKGVRMLCAAYDTYRNAIENPWPLVVVGKGDMDKELRASGATLLGFQDSKAVAALMRESCALVLPSLHEPWGVVVHEAACSAMILLCSDACGASDTLLQEGVNGFLFKAGDVEGLVRSLAATHRLSDGELGEFRRLSRTLASNYSPQAWTQTLARIIRM